MDYATKHGLSFDFLRFFFSFVFFRGSCKPDKANTSAPNIARMFVCVMKELKVFNWNQTF
jgi:hypothetical protein